MKSKFKIGDIVVVTSKESGVSFDVNDMLKVIDIQDSIYGVSEYLCERIKDKAGQYVVEEQIELVEGNRIEVGDVVKILDNYETRLFKIEEEAEVIGMNAHSVIIKKGEDVQFISFKNVMAVYRKFEQVTILTEIIKNKIDYINKHILNT